MVIEGVALHVHINRLKNLKKQKQVNMARKYQNYRPNNVLKIRNSIVELRHNKVTVLCKTRKYTKNYTTKQ